VTGIHQKRSGIFTDPIPVPHESWATSYHEVAHDMNVM